MEGEFNLYNSYHDDYLSMEYNSSDQQLAQGIIDPLKILNLCTNLSSHTTSIQIQIILNKFLQDITNAPYVFIIPILSNNEEGLIQVIGDKILDKEKRFSITADNIRNASTKDFQFLINDINLNFRDFIQTLTGTRNTLFYDIKELNKNIKSILTEMIPLDQMSAESSATGLTNCSKLLDDLTTLPPSADGHMQISFFVCIAGDETCQVYFRYCIYETLRFTIGHLLTAIELDEERRNSNKCQYLLDISRQFLGKLDVELIENREISDIRLLTIKYDILKCNSTTNVYAFESKDINRLLQGVMLEAKEITGAERCDLFLLDKYTGELLSKNQNNEIRVLQSGGITGHVAETGELLNIRNAYNHPLFNKKIDEQPGFKTRNLLCFPIYDREQIIGVCQLHNKSNSYHFDKRDEQAVKVFSTYICLSIMYVLVEKSVQFAEARHKLSIELITYHMKISDQEIKELVETLENIDALRIPNLSSFTFRTRDLDHQETLKASLQMFADLDFVNKFRIRPVKLATFILTIQKGYRDLPFHNWMHGFTVAHFAYALLMNCSLRTRGVLSEIEAISFLVSTFCHDIDHRASTNIYHKESKNALAILYNNEGSINERHHLSLTRFILQDDETKILESFSPEQSQLFMAATKEFILSTDLAHHFIILNQLGTLRKDNCSENKHMSMSLLITCCDLSDQIKEWPNTQHVSVLIYNEFFAQGDLEKQMGIPPVEMMDRQKAVIPRLQSEFIIDAVLPAFEVLGNILPETKYLLDIINDNLEHWQILLQADNEQKERKPN